MKKRIVAILVIGVLLAFSSCSSEATVENSVRSSIQSSNSNVDSNSVSGGETENASDPFISESSEKTPESKEENQEKTETTTSSKNASIAQNVSSHTHQYQKKIIKEATCTQEGTAEYVCAGCKESYREKIAPLGHSYTEKVIKAASCTKAGKKEEICSRCGKKTTKEIPATGHDWQAADCLTPKTCRICGATTGSPTKHSVNAYGICSNCGTDVLLEQCSISVEGLPVSIHDEDGEAVITSADFQFENDYGDLKLLPVIKGKITATEGGGDRIISFLVLIKDENGAYVATEGYTFSGVPNSLDTVDNFVIHIDEPGHYTVEFRNKN